MFSKNCFFTSRNLKVWFILMKNRSIFHESNFAFVDVTRTVFHVLVLMEYFLRWLCQLDEGVDQVGHYKSSRHTSATHQHFRMITPIFSMNVWLITQLVMFRPYIRPISISTGYYCSDKCHINK